MKCFWYEISIFIKGFSAEYSLHSLPPFHFGPFPSKDEWLRAALDCLHFLPDQPVVELSRALSHCFLQDPNAPQSSMAAAGSRDAGAREYQKLLPVWSRERFSPQTFCVTSQTAARWVLEEGVRWCPRWRGAARCGPMEAAAV